MIIMKHFTDLHITKTKSYSLIGIFLLLSITFLSLFIGKYPLSLEKLIAGDPLQWRVFLTLRCSRTLVGCIGGFALGITGFVYQTVFRNSLASPDIIGVSSGASAGAAMGILFFSSAIAITISAFTGAIISTILSLALANMDKHGKSSTIVLSGIAVNSLAQTFLMYMKLTADPERELASIEYWLMGSLSGISLYSLKTNLLLCVLGTIVLCYLHRQIVLLSTEEGEARMLGVPVNILRLIILFTATLIVASVISLTGLISFVGLLAPHGARLLTKNNRLETMILSGIIGGILLCASDILARSLASTELPISIFTSLLGAPFLIFLVVRERRTS